MADISDIIHAIRWATSSKEILELHAPSFGELEKKYVLKCIESSWVSSNGYYLNQFESALSAYCQVDYVVCCVNATAGLHIALKAIGVKSGDEVLAPAFSFVATANAICHAEAIPHFVDICPENMGVCPLKLGEYLQSIVRLKSGNAYNKFSGRKISALIVVHCFGYPARLHEIIKVCETFHIPLVEDAAEGLGSFYKNKHVGGFGKVSVLSFNGNKIITTGGGGAILTNDSYLAQKIRHLITTAKKPHSWEYIHDEIGYNYRMPNLNAALGLAQIEKLNQFLDSKKVLHDRYQQVFQSMSDIKLLTDTKDTCSNHWLNTLMLSEKLAPLQPLLLKQAHKNGVFIRPIWKMLPRQVYLKECPAMDLSNAEQWENRVINLPSSSFLGISRD